MSSKARIDLPWRFLVSTTRAAGNIREGLGTPAYSYYFAVEALAPVLDRLGEWTLVERPESRLPFLAAKARSEGFQPVHLCINPLQDSYFSPALPNIALPFWEFPDIPDRDFLDDSRQNWKRTASGADLILTACRFTADAFRRARVSCQVAVVPMPVNESFFDLPRYDPHHQLNLNCRHEIFGARGSSVPAIPSEVSSGSSIGHNVWNHSRSVFRKVAPHLRPETVDQIGRLAGSVKRLRRRPFGRLIFDGSRSFYRSNIRPWLSDLALERITRAKERAFSFVRGSKEEVAIDPLLPSGPLELSGLVYLTIFNVGDPRKNPMDLLSAYLLAHRDRPDVTLVIKLVTSPRCEHAEVGVLRSKYGSLGIEHRCRVVVIPEYLSDEAMSRLFQTSTYYVNTSHAEGACLPLMRSLAGGRPAIVCAHSAMTDYIDDQVAFIPKSNEEPAAWPHDPEGRMETTRHRLVWSDLRDAFITSARIFDRDPERYAEMSRAAQLRMRKYASTDAVEVSLRLALSRLPQQSRLAS